MFQLVGILLVSAAATQCAVKYPGTNSAYLSRSAFSYPADEFTIALWAASSASAATWTSNAEFCLWDFGFDSVADMQSLRVSANGVTPIITVNDASSSSDTATISIPSDGLWHHVALSWKKATGEWVLYVDSQQAKIGTLGAGVTLGTNGFWILGQDMGVSPGVSNLDSTESFSGYLADVSIWSVALSQTSVIDLFKNLAVPLSATQSGLYAYWPLADRCNTAGTTTKELVASKSLAITGALTWSRQPTLPVNSQCSLDFGSVPQVNRYAELLNYAWPAPRAFTLSVWVKSNVTPWTTGTNTYMMTYGITGDSNVWNLIWAANGSNLRARIGGTEFSASSNTATVVLPPDQNWHHVAVSWNGDILRHFVDGVLLREQSGIKTTYSFPGPGTLVFGQDFDSPTPTAYDASSNGNYDSNQNFRGMMDDFLLAGSFTDLAGVQRLMSGDRTGFPGTSFWNFNECSRTRAYPESSPTTNALHIANIASNAMWSTVVHNPTQSWSQSRSQSQSQSHSQSQSQSQTVGDPHFRGLAGQKYLIGGEPGLVYNIISTPGLLVNALFGSSVGPHHYTVMHEIGVVVGTDTIFANKNNRLQLNGEKAPSYALLSDGVSTLTRDINKTGDGITLRTPEFFIRFFLFFRFSFSSALIYSNPAGLRAATKSICWRFPCCVLGTAPSTGCWGSRGTRASGRPAR
eukprot:TRINITY_DN5217_c0_g1_i4.p1 TRINITY_DN5217_c0_g1~~TRINITY_DN5217_c0_g1_i4.p1  ORF type:complete len:690 (-),score=101.82 TRINITY_DN5217_c0_g1_i4:95-2164(-)